MKKLCIVLLLFSFLGCAGESAVFPDEGYSPPCDPNSDGFLLTLQGYDSNGVFVDERDYSSTSLGTCDYSVAPTDTTPITNPNNLDTEEDEEE